jgi:hypothetical protein
VKGARRSRLIPRGFRQSPFAPKASAEPAKLYLQQINVCNKSLVVDWTRIISKNDIDRDCSPVSHYHKNKKLIAEKPVNRDHAGEDEGQSDFGFDIGQPIGEPPKSISCQAMSDGWPVTEYP